jgi:hypothetical protein
MTDNNELETLCALVADHERRLTAHEQQLAVEKAERLALQQTVIPATAETRKELDLHVEYLTGRLESLKARPAGDVDPELVEAIQAAYHGVLQVLKFQNELDDRVRWLTGVVTRDMEARAREMGIEV